MDPVAAHAFAVEIDGITEALFREATGFDSENQVIEYQHQGEKGITYYHKQPGTMKWQNITLKRGITDNTKLWDWRKQVIDGKIGDARKDGSIVGYDPTGAEVVRYSFTRGWPSKWTASGMNAQGNEVVIEELEIVHEGLVRGKK
jgi:phage tail-like protein